ncbi:hypothetical protein IGI37_000499 [Enterococcus sp. AZ194]|uniref:HutD family protein n=1 Tax=Enterococcus sp. AZ194 TaxID=2774629 RepID=UPI003F239BF6
MAYKLLQHVDYSTTKLNGVDTIEIFKYPKTSSFATKDFDLRISSAKMYQQVTEFTHLPNYFRELMLLFGKVRLEHYEPDALRTEHLSPYEIDRFSGDHKTLNFGLSEDFNLIYKKDFLPAPKLSLLKHNESILLDLNNNQFALIYSVKPLIEIDIIPENEYLIDSVVLKEQDSLLMRKETAKLVIHNGMPGSSIEENVAILCLFELPADEKELAEIC